MLWAQHPAAGGDHVLPKTPAGQGKAASWHHSSRSWGMCVLQLVPARVFGRAGSWDSSVSTCTSLSLALVTPSTPPKRLGRRWGVNGPA